MTVAFDPLETFVLLDGAGRAEPIALYPGFWEDLAAGRREAAGWLVTRGVTSAPWDHWERHPNGEELILLTDGSADLILEWKSGEEPIRLTREKPLAIVPRGVWHTVDPVSPATLTFITYGKGTEHRPREG